MIIGLTGIVGGGNLSMPMMAGSSPLDSLPELTYELFLAWLYYRKPGPLSASGLYPLVNGSAFARRLHHHGSDVNTRALRTVRKSSRRPSACVT